MKILLKGEVLRDSGRTDMNEDNLILVNIFDEQVGTMGKEAAHREGRLHRAFSVFLYHGNRMLIQRRALHKYHSGGLWANSCCSHPRDGEELTEAVRRRLVQELGVSCECRELFSFVYRHQFHEALYEYEYDHVFIGEYDGSFELNPEEAMDAAWIGLDELAQDLTYHPEWYCVWFQTAAPKVIRHIKNNRS